MNRKGALQNGKENPEMDENIETRKREKKKITAIDT